MNVSRRTPQLEDGWPQIAASGTAGILRTRRRYWHGAGSERRPHRSVTHDGGQHLAVGWTEQGGTGSGEIRFELQRPDRTRARSQCRRSPQVLLPPMRAGCGGSGTRSSSRSIPSHASRVCLTRSRRAFKPSIRRSASRRVSKKAGWLSAPQSRMGRPGSSSRWRATSPSSPFRAARIARARTGRGVVASRYRRRRAPACLSRS